MAVSWKVFCICHRAKLTRMREKGGSEPVFRIPLLHYGVPRFRISSKNTPLHYRVPFLHCPNPFHLFFFERASPSEQESRRAEGTATLGPGAWRSERAISEGSFAMAASTSGATTTKPYDTKYKYTTIKEAYDKIRSGEVSVDYVNLYCVVLDCSTVRTTSGTDRIRNIKVADSTTAEMG